MTHRVILGGQWGDEGKAKIVDALAVDADVVVRFQGGANAGHTVVADGVRYAFHLIPSGILRPGTICVMGNGTVIDPLALVAEVRELEEGGIAVGERLRISRSAHIVLPTHKAAERAGEASADAAIGTTLRGIGPAYVEKVARTGLRMEVFDLPPEALPCKLETHLERGNERLAALGVEPIDVAGSVEALVAVRDELCPLLEDTSYLLDRARAEGNALLFEGAQGTLLDVDHGTYPYLTSSNCTLGGVLTGAGVGLGALGDVLGVFKAYCTRVGNGPFPTELLGEEGGTLRERGGEFGTTTGRPRRCGWFDAVAARYAVMVNGMVAAVLTKLDVLDGVDPIRIATRYRIDGVETDRFPAGAARLGGVVPIYEEVPGWQGRVRGVTRWDDAPEQARAYVQRLETMLGIPIRWVSTGPERHEILDRESR